MRSLLSRWVAAFTVGELLGFGGIPVLGGAAAFALTRDLPHEARAIALYLVAVIGGLGEGAVLAWFQTRVLRRVWPQLHVRRFIGATALAASFAWACGMAPGTLDDLVGLTDAAQIALWLPAAVLILLSIGWAQARVLHTVVERPMRWLWANVCGWLAGLPFTFVLPAMMPETAPATAWIACFVVAGVLMGATAGLVTGLFLRGMARESFPGDCVDVGRR